MKTTSGYRVAVQVIACILAATASARADPPDLLPEYMVFANPSGVAATYSTDGPIDLRNPFFADMGTNGRACVTCHQPADGWTVTPAGIKARFEATNGTDPIFRTNDGSNSPHADVSTLDARRGAYSMLLNKGLIRIGMAIPSNAEFELIAADDPYGYASAAELSLFRRPLPISNVKYLNTVMWDGRETFKDASSTTCIVGSTNCFATLHFNLTDQANTATATHAQATHVLTSEERDAIVTFENSLFTAQVFDAKAGDLTMHDGQGGPETLAQQNYYFGVNDVVSGDYRTGAAFDSSVFRLYDPWLIYQGAGGRPKILDERAEARLAVARGQRLFNTNPIRITGVKGLNDDLNAPVIDGTCTTCHDTPGIGNHSIPAPLDIGITDESRRTPDLPLYTLRNKTTGAMIVTSDPGRALVTGKWNDIGKFKGPILRALATRAPYFHNGSAADIDAAVDFYNDRFGIGLTSRQHADLVAFLRTL
jgi:cytochrome c peroxidase